MKKRTSKKLALGKIKIASLNGDNLAKIKAGKRTTVNTLEPTTSDTSDANPSAITACLICPDYNTRRC